MAQWRPAAPSARPARMRGVTAVVGGLVIGGLAIGACHDATPDRVEVVGVVADEGEATMLALVPVAEAASAAVDALCDDASPDQDVSDASAAIDAARLAWHRSEGYWFGSVTERRSPGFVDWPVNESDVDGLLAADEPATIDAAYLRGFVGADTRGYTTAGYLLERGTLDARRCAFLSAATTVAENEIVAVVQEWTAGDETMPAETDRLREDPNAAIDAMVNQLLILASSRDRIDIVARSLAIEQLVFGVDGDAGVGALVGDDLAARLRAEVVAVVDAATTATDDDEVITAALDALRATIGTEVVSVLGVTVTFSDADGDSAG